jgi:hypothetical protein
MWGERERASDFGRERIRGRGYTTQSLSSHLPPLSFSLVQPLSPSPPHFLSPSPCPSFPPLRLLSPVLPLSLSLSLLPLSPISLSLSLSYPPGPAGPLALALRISVRVLGSLRLAAVTVSASPAGGPGHLRLSLRVPPGLSFSLSASAPPTPPTPRPPARPSPCLHSSSLFPNDSIHVTESTSVCHAGICRLQLGLQPEPADLAGGLRLRLAPLLRVRR